MSEQANTPKYETGFWVEGIYYGYYNSPAGNKIHMKIEPDNGDAFVISAGNYATQNDYYNVMLSAKIKENKRLLDVANESIEPTDSSVKKPKCPSCEKAKDQSRQLKEATERTGLMGTVRKFAKGIPGAVKANFGIDSASQEVVSLRQAICESCDTYDFGICDESKGGCGCVCAWKTRLGSESCPKEKWEAVNV
tara:strand:+ start:4371 stop:4952 length:582 start_codon:yes stop_codon:yes gene_type:complete